MMTNKNYESAVDVLCLKGLPRDVSKFVLLKTYKGDGVGALSVGEDWLFMLDEFYPLFNVDATWHWCARNNKLNIMQHLYYRGIVPSNMSAIIEACAICDYLHILYWLENVGLLKKQNNVAMDYAVKCGHLEIVKFLYSMGYVITNQTLFHCVFNRHFSILQWQYNNSDLRCSEAEMLFAVGSGQLQIVKFIYANDNNGSFRYARDWIDHCLLASIESQQHIVSHWLFSKLNKKKLKRTLKYACNQGSLVMLQWLHLNCVNGWSSCLMDIACEQGNIAMVQWFHVNRKEGCTEKAMYYAIFCKNLELIKYLYENGYCYPCFSSRSSKYYAPKCIKKCDHENTDYCGCWSSYSTTVYDWLIDTLKIDRDEFYDMLY